ncbi:molybdenum cofactor biosynthesis protein F, partial [Pseudomonas aeruginosa]
HMQENGRPVAVSQVLYFDNQAFSAVLGQLPDRTACEQGLVSRALAGRQLTGFEAEFLHGSLDRPWQPGAC